MQRYYSPLRYPGGKSKIVPLVKEVIKRNNLFDCEYFEPYAGGASVALELLENEYTRKIYINDIDVNIYSFWESIINNTEKFCEKIRNINIDAKEWERQREILFFSKEVSIFQRGFAAFYLNRTNRSGILKGGIIGGKKQDGIWKINARFNKEALIERIVRIAKYKNRIKIDNLDAIEFLKKYEKNISNKGIVFLDPPYFIKGKDLYLNFYNTEDHINLKNVLYKMEKAKWILTYDASEEIISIYNDKELYEYNIDYSAGIHTLGKEIIAFSKSLRLPLLELEKLQFGKSNL